MSISRVGKLATVTLLFAFAALSISALGAPMKAQDAFTEIQKSVEPGTHAGAGGCKVTTTFKSVNSFKSVEVEVLTKDAKQSAIFYLQTNYPNVDFIPLQGGGYSVTRKSSDSFQKLTIVKKRVMIEGTGIQTQACQL